MKHSHAVQIHGWLLCLAWGFFIPLAIVIASFRSMLKLNANCWYYAHIVLAITGLLASLAGVTIPCYFDFAFTKRMKQHRIIGIIATVLAGIQVRMQICLYCRVMPNA